MKIHLINNYHILLQYTINIIHYKGHMYQCHTNSLLEVNLPFAAFFGTATTSLLKHSVT